MPAFTLGKEQATQLPIPDSAQRVDYAGFRSRFPVGSVRVAHRATATVLQYVESADLVRDS
jgi:hypothetical protein